MTPRDLISGLGRVMPSFSETQAETRYAAQVVDEALLRYLRTQVKLPRFGLGLWPFVPVLPPPCPSSAMLRRYRDA